MDNPIHQPITNRTMPACTILPVLTYTDLEQSIAWLSKTFGFTERWRVGNHRAQLAYDDGVIVLTAKHNAGTHSPAAATNDHSLLVRVKDVAAHYERAKKNGASILEEPADYLYGERQYSCLDPDGHVWMFSQSIADLAPEDWGGVSANKKG
jgi:uncharacterized glyoxalase superfamily protein PhnB